MLQSPGVLTMTIAAMVAPRKTSTEVRRVAADVTVSECCTSDARCRLRTHIIGGHAGPVPNTKASTGQTANTSDRGADRLRDGRRICRAGRRPRAPARGRHHRRAGHPRRSPHAHRAPDRLHGHPRAANGDGRGRRARRRAAARAKRICSRPKTPSTNVNAIVLSGGSAFGLDAATGVMRFLGEKNIGYTTSRRRRCRSCRPRFCSTSSVGGRPDIRPDASCGMKPRGAAKIGTGRRRIRRRRRGRDRRQDAGRAAAR